MAIHTKSREYAIFLSTLSLRRATHGVQDAMQGKIFLSTLSLRRATPGGRAARVEIYNFYPRSPCGERLEDLPPRYRAQAISIHALLAESDGGMATLSISNVYFYPRSPCGERQRLKRDVESVLGISIHALLAESDPSKSNKLAKQKLVFLSTLSLRRATGLDGRFKL